MTMGNGDKAAKGKRSCARRYVWEEIRSGLDRKGFSESGVQLYVSGYLGHVAGMLRRASVARQWEVCVCV